MSAASTVFPLLLLFISCLFYLIYWIPYQSPNVHSAVFKCLPIISLCLLVYFNKSESDAAFGRGLLLALVFSGAGDAIFIKPAMWTGFVGTLLFGIAQIAYMSTFGFHPWRWDIGCVCLLSFSAFVWYADCGKFMSLPVRAVCVGYLLFLFIMCWRVTVFSIRIAEVSFVCDMLGMAALTGALSFVLSDLLIVLHLTVTKIPKRTHWVMTTYFLAQLGLGLAVYHSDYGCHKNKNHTD